MVSIVDHSIMKDRLERSFGGIDSSLQWFETYLTGRLQFVHLVNESMAPYILEDEVSQGSALGALLPHFISVISN